MKASHRVGTGVENSSNNKVATEVFAWALLRRLVESSRVDVLQLLWPDGDVDAPAEIEQLISRIRGSDETLPEAFRKLSATKGAQLAAQASSDLGWAQANGWRLITPDSAEWPSRRLEESFGPLGDLAYPTTDRGGGHSGGESMRNRAARPFALWAQGPANLGSTVERSVSLVGTRSATAYGTRIAHRMSGELSAAGYSVISGGALGIDSSAHSGALEVSGTTIAVIANGPGEIYPRANSGLFQQISRTGLIISEYPPLQRPARYRFLTRNRLVAGLSCGTVLLAAGYRSGAINTANWADAMLRPVMVLPGPVDSAEYVGCHQRIRSGAGTLITRAEDVRELIEPVGSVDTEQQLDLDFRATPVQELRRDQLTVFDACGISTDDTGRLEDIAAETAFPLPVVVRIIGEIEARGLVVRSGDRWIKVDR